MSNKKIIALAAVFILTGLFANTQTAETDYDNTVTEIIKPFDTKEVLKTLDIELELRTRQRKGIAEIFSNYEKEYDKLASDYSEKAKKLAADREMLVNIRREIDKNLNSVPCIIKPHLYGLQVYKYREMAKKKYPDSNDIKCFDLEKRKVPAKHPEKRKVPLEKQPAL
jgi:Skp family chaperone for outer membrane proteins